ncbi:MAG TPA: HAD family hydrolase [Longimicrobiales bacterium]|nr:HAD family hydrolase [Longimicrobiales bacterium]
MSTPGQGLVLATDLDGTMAHGDAGKRDRLATLLREHQDARLIYVTGRTPEAARVLAERVGLPVPDVLIADVGTSVLRGLGPERVDAIEAELDGLWPGGAVVRGRLAALAPELVEQEVVAPRRVSYWVERVRRGRGPEPGAGDPFAARLPGDASLDEAAAAHAASLTRRALERLEGLGVDVLVSANVFLDVLPGGVDKGSTLRRVLAWLGASDDECVVAGDSINDLAMFETGMRGIVVANCEPALRRRAATLDRVYQAAEEGVGGVLEGLRHHGHFAEGPEGGGTDGE